MYYIFVSLGVLIVLTAASHYLLAANKKKALVKGWVSYQDLDGTGTPYTNKALGLKVKPDAIDSGKVIEYKSGDGSRGPREGDLLQLCGIMLATGLEEAELRYSNRNYQVKNSNDLKNKVVDVIQKMRYHLATRTLPHGKPTPNKCKKCLFTADCPDAASHVSVG